MFTIQLNDITSLKATFIEASSFEMGSPSDEIERSPDETQHQVTLTNNFYMMTSTVTQAQFQALMGYNPSHFRGENLPVEKISWHEAADFANALSVKEEKERCFVCKGKEKQVICKIKPQFEGKNYYKCKGWRLPTEAEWEYAYRAGTTTPFYTGKCLSSDEANYDGNYPAKTCQHGLYRQKTIDVETLKPNAWGLYDMAGNVREWIYDLYQKDLGNIQITDPIYYDEGLYRVLRGGGWGYDAWSCRAANRLRLPPTFKNFALGVRLVQTQF